MKYVSIWRHAKAERPEGYASDFERPLTERGHKDAGMMSALLLRLNPGVDLILSSPSARTAQTTQHLLEVADIQADPQWHTSIYLAAAETLLGLIRELPESTQHVVVVGHNPGLEELASGLCGSAPEDVFVRMPTAALAHVAIDVTHWSMVRWGAAELRLLVTPKAIK
ncbi:MAG: histidine phosphatase family protein [Caldilinea sp.]|nr:histidine phosphatase family protein [Caldilinea sp.]MCB0150882.1 histidine phosphatase family protein [Caldilineaceae bacterium]MCB0053940.1 histidine phosphatase family protein [Caldilinea sp.]MCB9117743.1 histidine phosphatase family protein [Caldilineaceae bacterium]MCB9123857.1 histidine phosphatase family protein [Caldilineaceae bacterium]